MTGGSWACSPRANSNPPLPWCSGAAMPVVVYVIKSRQSGRRYVGTTDDLARRLRQHMGGGTKAGQLLGQFFLLHSERLPDYSTARARERFLKSGQGRRWLDQVEVERATGASGATARHCSSGAEGCPSG